MPPKCKFQEGTVSSFLPAVKTEIFFRYLLRFYIQFIDISAYIFRGEGSVLSRAVDLRSQVFEIVYYQGETSQISHSLCRLE